MLQCAERRAEGSEGMKRCVCFLLMVVFLATLAACAELAEPDTTEATRKPAVCTPEPETAPPEDDPAAPAPIARRLDAPDFNIHDYDEQTILDDPELTAYCLEHCQVEDFLHWEDTERSSCFCAVAYSPIFRTLAVEFRDSGAIYYYYDLEPETAEDFFAADSLGRYFNRNIKGRYDYERVR